MVVTGGGGNEGSNYRSGGQDVSNLFVSIGRVKAWCPYPCLNTIRTEHVLL